MGLGRSGQRREREPGIRRQTAGLRPALLLAGAGARPRRAVVDVRHSRMDDGLARPVGLARELDRRAGWRAGARRTAVVTQGIRCEQAVAARAAARFGNGSARSVVEWRGGERPPVCAGLERLLQTHLLRKLRRHATAPQRSQRGRRDAGQRHVQRDRRALCEVHGLVRTAQADLPTGAGVRRRHDGARGVG